MDNTIIQGDKITAEIIDKIKDAYCAGFKQAHYSWVHPDTFPVKELQAALNEYINSLTPNGIK